jgi:hypothetical protein
METITSGTKSRIVTLIQILALLMALAMTALALRLLGVGIQITRIATFTLTDLTASPQLQVTYNHYPPALVYLLAAVGMVFGLLRLKLSTAWFSLAAFSAWSLLFFFTSGTAFIPFIAIQAVLLSVLSLMKMSSSGENRLNVNGEQLHGV